MKKRTIIIIIAIILFIIILSNISKKQPPSIIENKSPSNISIQPPPDTEYNPSEQTFNVKIIVDTKTNLGKISPLIYGTNSWIENTKFGFPTNPTGDKKLFYKSQISKFNQYFDLAKQTSFTILRIPGGLQANHDDFHDYIGPYEDRPQMKASGINQIVIPGIDEHLAVAKDIDSEIIYTVNYAQGPEAAADLVRSTGVKYYEIGNELNCGMKKGAPLIKKIAEDYARNVVKISDAMKAVDPTIKIGALDDCNKKLGTDWYDTVYSIAGEKFDFWIKHAYSPGSDGAVKGVTINDEKFSIKTTHNFKSSGTYEFEILAEGKKHFDNLPGFDLLIDGNKVGSVTINEFGGILKTEPSPKFYKISAQVTSGIHQVEIITHNSVENNAFLRVHPLISANNEVIDFRDDKKILGLITAGAITVGEAIQEEKELYHGKPIYMTEWNTVYSFDECSGILKDKKHLCNTNTNLREALNVADYYHMFLNKKEFVHEANFWLLWTEIGNMDVRGNQIVIHPSFYVNQLYSNNLRGNHIKTTVESPTYDVGYSTGITLGKVSKSLTINYISTVASLDKNILSIAIINKHPNKDSAIALEGVPKEGTLYQIYSPNLGDNQVSIEEKNINTNNLIIPRHSINIISYQI
ncbi:alpha-L-arabinofuranosidase C-terminal domain-containing protein [Nanoarchaeota archaeon]